MKLDEDTITEEFNCSVLHGIALIQITKRTFSSGDTVQEGRPAFDWCFNVYDCGIIATPLAGGGHSFDWYKCPAWQSINSSGKA